MTFHSFQSCMILACLRPCEHVCLYFLLGFLSAFVEVSFQISLARLDLRRCKEPAGSQYSFDEGSMPKAKPSFFHLLLVL